MTEDNDKLKGIDIKNRTLYYLDDIIGIEDFDPDNTLIDRKPDENIIVYQFILVYEFMMEINI